MIFSLHQLARRGVSVLAYNLQRNIKSCVQRFSELRNVAAHFIHSSRTGFFYALLPPGGCSSDAFLQIITSSTYKYITSYDSMLSNPRTPNANTKEKNQQLTRLPQA